jgi:hypothetical protein
MLRLIVVYMNSPVSGAISDPMKDHNGTIRVVKFCSGSHKSSSGVPSMLASAGAGDFKPRLWDISTGKILP